MKKMILAVLLTLCACAWAAETPKQSDYTINVHVSTSSIAIDLGYQILNVVIDGKKYTLGSEARLGKLLALGDYKAKIAKDEHKAAYDSEKVYEFLFADGKTRQFLLIEQSE